tara:strand:- start:6301 stop:6840 length:540 start_codon:yes stop_codon:yes gene_type:complete
MIMHAVNILKRTSGTVMFCVLILGNLGVQATAGSAEHTVIGKSGYPVPRFVSLARDKVNVRTGPDKKYPIKWVFHKKGLPVKVVAEYGDWRKIIDSEGASGWIWGPLLSSRRMGLVLADRQAFHRKPDPDSEVTVLAEAGVLGEILECENAWCRMELQGFKGWVPQDHIWGCLKREEFD